MNVQNEKHTKMKVCVVGSYSGKLDEGMANVSYYIHKNLEKKINQVILLNVNDNTKSKFWKKLFSFKPDIIHYVPGPTGKGLFLLRILQILTNCKTVVSATKPDLSPSFKLFSQITKPNIVVTQSENSHKIFNKFSYQTKFVPNGVDIQKFSPIETNERKMLRESNGFRESDFIVLHIGPISQGRNQKYLLEIPEAKILLITSKTTPSDNYLIKELRSDRTIIISEFLSNVEKFYGLSDVYIFPLVQPKKSIDIPLSILEAMACNMPVITTRFGGIEKILNQGEGLFFIDKPEEIKEKILEIRNNKVKVNTRKKILEFGWEKIIEQYVQIYMNLLRKSK